MSNRARSKMLTTWFNATGAAGSNKSERPAHIAHYSNSMSSSGLRRNGPPSSLNMSNMAYALPDHHSQPSPFETHHMAPQYPSAPHTPGVAYHMPAVGQFPGQSISGSVPFNMPFTPSYPPYTLAQQSQHVSWPYPPFVANPQGIGAGHSPVYGAGYYPHPPYATPYGNGPHPLAGQQRQCAFQARQGSRAPAATQVSSSRGEDRGASEAEYDVSKTIVDGSNPMRLVQPSLAPGKLASSSTKEVRRLINLAAIQMRHPVCLPPQAHHEVHHASRNNLVMRFGLGTCRLGQM